MINTLRSIFSRNRLALLGAALLTLLPQLAEAQLEVNSTLTPDEYVNDVLLGTGVEATNVQLTGSPVQIGHIFGFASDDFPIAEGLILSTEVANNPANIDDGCMQDFIDDGLEVSGDPDLLDIANSVPPLIGQSFSVSSVNDVCAIEFDFVATGDTIKLQLRLWVRRVPGLDQQPVQRHLRVSS